MALLIWQLRICQSCLLRLLNRCAQWPAPFRYILIAILHIVLSFVFLTLNCWNQLTFILLGDLLVTVLNSSLRLLVLSVKQSGKIRPLFFTFIALVLYQLRIKSEFNVTRTIKRNATRVLSCSKFSEFARWGIF